MLTPAEQTELQRLRHEHIPIRAIARRLGQVDELIDAARVPVFLLDQQQTVRLGEIGMVEVIRATTAARQLEDAWLQVESIAARVRDRFVECPRAGIFASSVRLAHLA